MNIALFHGIQIKIIYHFLLFYFFNVYFTILIAVNLNFWLSNWFLICILLKYIKSFKDSFDTWIMFIFYNILIYNSPQDNQDYANPIKRFVREEITKKWHNHKHISIQIQQHKIFNTVSDLSSAFILFKIGEYQIILVDLVFNIEI